MTKPTSEQMQSMSLAEIQAAYGETPNFADIKVYEPKNFFPWLDGVLAGEDGRSKERDIWNLSDLIKHTRSIEDIRAYYNSKDAETKTWLVDLRDHLDHHDTAHEACRPCTCGAHEEVPYLGVLYGQGKVWTTVSQANFSPDWLTRPVEDTPEWVRDTVENLAKIQYRARAVAEETKVKEEERAILQEQANRAMIALVAKMAAEAAG